MPGLILRLIFILSLAQPGTGRAVDLSGLRWFTRPAERSLLDSPAPTLPVPVEAQRQSSESRQAEPLVTGVVTRSRGPATLWIQGRPLWHRPGLVQLLNVAEAREGSPRVAVHLPGLGSLTLGYGSSIAGPSAGRGASIVDTPPYQEIYR